MIPFRLDSAKQYLDDATELFRQRRFNSCASRAYYASYQAMWSALGTPVGGKVWKHLAIINHFVRGYWYDSKHPNTGPGLLEEKRLALRRLYSYRIKSDYNAVEISESSLIILLDTVEQIIRIVEEKGESDVDKNSNQ